MNQDRGVTSSISVGEADGPGANPGFLTSVENKNAQRALKEIGLSDKRILLVEQSQPRHKDLNAGIWMRAVRRARKESHNAQIRQPKVIHHDSTI